MAKRIKKNPFSKFLKEYAATKDWVEIQRLIKQERKIKQEINMRKKKRKR